MAGQLATGNEPLTMDLGIRHFVYQCFVATAQPPSPAEIAAQFGLPESETRTALERLHNNHFFFLQPGTTDIRMANPFSAVPTNFTVQVEQKLYWANCAWDMLGIPAALQSDAEIEARYEDTAEPIIFQIREGKLEPTPGVVHFPLPVRQWYEDLIKT